MSNRSQRSYKIPTYGKVEKTNPSKLTFTGNFTQQHKHFNIMPERDSTRQEILNSVRKRTESIMQEQRDSDGMNPLYEDPRDVISAKPAKPPRKRNVQGLAVTSPRSSKDGRSQLKEQKRKLTRKYQGLIAALMDKCEEYALLVSEKDGQISKLKEKARALAARSRQLAGELERLRESGRRAGDAEERCRALEEQLRRYQLPDKDGAERAGAVPLVEVCVSCSSRQVLLRQAREHAARLQRDMRALKDVLYRLNVQLSRYQEKVRSCAPALTSQPADRPDGLDSLLDAALPQPQEARCNEESQSNKGGSEAARLVDTSGLLSAQALAPLFDAYQENLQEKDNLIMDYEKQFENMNKRSKLIVEENKSLGERVSTLEDELVQARQSYKKLVVEKETADIEKVTLVERVDKAETKLKEVYELYEDKMAAMSRDYETVHREYCAARGALDACAGRERRTVPADLHERRLDHCKRLLEELKHQYGMEGERREAQLRAARDELRAAQERGERLRTQLDQTRGELAAAQKDARLYRKAAAVFRQRARAAAARAARASRKRSRSGSGEPLRRALDALERIKLEIKEVRSRARASLEELERRVAERERRAAHAQAECRRELQRAALALDHKEGIIRSLIDKVADVEEVRLSQTNTHRLQGIVSESSPERSSSPKSQEKREPKGAKLVPGPGGYFQERDSRRTTKS